MTITQKYVISNGDMFDTLEEATLHEDTFALEGELEKAGYTTKLSEFDALAAARYLMTFYDMTARDTPRQWNTLPGVTLTES